MNLDDIRTSSNDISEEKAKKQTFIPINKLSTSKKNSKILIVKDDLKDSIAEDGLIQPLIVKRLNNGKYEILSGNRRYTSILSLLKQDTNFKYRYMGNQLIDPINDGLPCIIVERELSKDDEILMILEANKNREYDKLELYRMCIEGKKLYDNYKANELISNIRANEWLALRIPLSDRTITDILTDKWLINSSNVDTIADYGSYADYLNAKANGYLAGDIESDKKNNTSYQAFEKEYSYLDKIEKHHNKLDLDNMNLKDYQQDDLKDYAISVIKSIMNVYEIFPNDLK